MKNSVEKPSSFLDTKSQSTVANLPTDRMSMDHEIAQMMQGQGFPDDINKLIHYHRINSYLNHLAVGPFNPLLRPNLSSRNPKHQHLLRNIDFTNSETTDFETLARQVNMEDHR